MSNYFIFWRNSEHSGRPKKWSFLQAKHFSSFRSFWLQMHTTSLTAALLKTDIPWKPGSTQQQTNKQKFWNLNPLSLTAYEKQLKISWPRICSNPSLKVTSMCFTDGLELVDLLERLTPPFSHWWISQQQLLPNPSMSMKWTTRTVCRWFLNPQWKQLNVCRSLPCHLPGASYRRWRRLASMLWREKEPDLWVSCCRWQWSIDSSRDSRTASLAQWLERSCNAARMVNLAANLLILFTFVLSNFLPRCWILDPTDWRWSQHWVHKSIMECWY